MSKNLPILIVFLIISYNPILGCIPMEKQCIIKSDDIDNFIINKMEQYHLPGLSASIVIDDTVIWQNAYGYANIIDNVNVTNDTLFKIASVSKTITASALMQLYEDEYFNLFDPINDYLPYDVVNPNYPLKKINFHMLLTHSSSIKDNWDYLFYFVGDSPISFQTFLEEYLVPGGLYYDVDNNFCPWEPGSNFEYSNIAVALIGYLVEVISGMNFTDYVQTYLFNPLIMNESAWYLHDLNVSHIAMPYKWNGEEYIPYGHIGYVDVPAGDLRTSSSQLIHFLTMFINNGSYNNYTILNSSTVDLMLTPQLSFQPNLGLIWWKSTIGGRIVWGHNGVDFGARAMMHFDPNTKIGVIVLCNGDNDLLEICDMLFDFAETLLNSQPNTPIINGPNIGVTSFEYFFNSTTIDPNSDQIYYMFKWGDETYSEWLGPINSGATIFKSHSWSVNGNYEIRVKAKDVKNLESNWSEPLWINIIFNNLPNKPKINGPIIGRVGVNLKYKFTSSDPDGDQVKYLIDWGDGKNNITDLNPSSTNVEVSHTWKAEGKYIIKAKAQDSNGLIGPESTKTVTIPRNKVKTCNYLITKIFEHILLFERLLNL